MMHPNSILLFKKYAEGEFGKDAKVLEIGPDAIPHTEAKASSLEIIKMIKAVAGKGVFPPIEEAS